VSSQPAPNSPVSGGSSNHDERQWAMICHLSAMLMYATAIGGLIAPLIIWLLKRDTMPYVGDQGRETVNFQITTMLALVCSGVLMLVLIGWVLMPLVLLYHFVYTIIGTVKASEGAPFRYPICLRLLH
jgi:uncharacterized protein